MRALAVEDDPRIRADLAAALAAAGFRVETCADGEEAWFLGDTEDYDLVILDLGLPKMDGLAVLKRWRAGGQTVPVLVLTARGAWAERVEGIDAGADDYLPKPFRMEELLARVRALIRRANSSASSALVHGRLKLDMAARRLYCDGHPVDITARELAVLELLLLREGRVVTKQQIMDSLYGWEEASTSNAVEVFIYRLRKKLEATGVDISTVRGMGYLIEKANAQ